jgi:hypothetical protein
MLHLQSATRKLLLTYDPNHILTEEGKREQTNKTTNQPNKQQTNKQTQETTNQTPLRKTAIL